MEANPDPQALRKVLGRTAFAFRGYNTTNLGRTRELWEVPAYRETVERWLAMGDSVCRSACSRDSHLLKWVLDDREPDLKHYAEAVALVVAIEMAQIELLRSVHHVEFRLSKFAFGYSLGELAAVAASGMIEPRDAMSVPVTLATDCAAMADDVSMGILFSRTDAIDESSVVRLCDEISSAGAGIIGVSSVLSPNTYLILGMGETLQVFRENLREHFPKSISLKRDPNRWPPLHTPIVRQRYIPDRASELMLTMHQGPSKPTIFSLATGSTSYEKRPAREVLRLWVDHPQRMWDAVLYTLKSDAQLLIHVGPAPNLIPATFHRVSENVRQQLTRLSLSGLRLRAMSGLANRGWLANLLPSSASLLRAPTLQHVILEDWLLDHAPREGGVSSSSPPPPAFPTEK